MMNNMLDQYYDPCYLYNSFQDIEYFVVIDFEATCDKDTIPNPQEIIEFPSVIVSSATRELAGFFQTYVRPTCNKQLTDFCKNLTGITQTQVDNGVTLIEALQAHDNWLQHKGIKGSNFAVVTWSNCDCETMLDNECRYKNIKKPSYFNRWINLQVPFRQVFGGPERCKLKVAVQKAGLDWIGRHHCGLDDAKNTARLLASIMRMGFKLSITNSIPSERPCYFASPQVCHENIPLCYCGVKSSLRDTKFTTQNGNLLYLGCGNRMALRAGPCTYFRGPFLAPLDYLIN